MTMAKLPEDTTSDDEQGAQPDTLQGLLSSAPSASNRLGIPALPGKPQNPARHAPTAVAGSVPTFNVNPAFIPSNDSYDASEAPTDKYPIVSATTSLYAAAPEEKPAFGPFPPVDLADPIYTVETDDEDSVRPTAFQQLRYVIAKRQKYTLDALSLSDFSTIFTNIFEKRKRKELSTEEAEYLLGEYFETLPEKDAGSVFMDIVVAENNGLIRKEEAARYAIALGLTDGDKIIYGEIYTNLTGESVLPPRPSARKFSLKENEDTSSDKGISLISRFFSRKALLVSGLVLAAGGALVIDQNFLKTNDSTTSVSELTPVTPFTPEETQASTLKQVVAVEKPITEKVITPKIVTAPEAISPKITPAPKAVTRTAPAASSAPMAPKVSSSPEKIEGLSLPITTKNNSAGETVVDEAKSITAWKKLGYSVGIKTTPEGKVFLLTNKEGKKIIVSSQGLQKGQTAIEIK